MILFLAAEYTSIFNILRKACFSLNQRVKLFCVIRKFYQQMFGQLSIWFFFIY